VRRPGREDHPVDWDAIVDPEPRLARVPMNSDPHGADPEIAGVAERRARLRLVGPLEGVVVHADEQTRRGSTGAREQAGERRTRGEDTGYPAHALSIGSWKVRHE
jgi:hypothetical protein